MSMKLFLAMIGGLVASACAHNQFDVVPSEVPDKASPSVLLKVQGNVPDVKELRTALRAQLEARGIEVASGNPAGQSALLTVHVVTRPIQFTAYYKNGMRYFAPIDRLVLEAELTGAGSRKPYLELDLVLDSIITGASERGYESIEGRDALVKRAARFLSLVYLNTLGGSPEPIEGVWTDALSDTGEVVYRKDPARPRYNGMVIRSPTFAYDDNVYKVNAEAEAGAGVPRHRGNFKLKYLLGSGDVWESADVFVYGCLMVMEPTTNGTVFGKSFWVKDAERCVAD